MRGDELKNLELQFAWRVKRVDVDHHAARLKNAKQNCGVGHDIGRHDGGAVALGETLRQQPRRHLICRDAEFFIGEPDAETFQGDALAISGAASAPKINQCRVGLRLDFSRNARQIMGEPRPRRQQLLA